MTTMRICAVGDNVVDRYVDRGVMYPGGNAVNVAVHAARCGAAAAYIGAVGDDAAGTAVATALTAEGVELARLRRVAGSNAYAEVRVVAGDRVFGDHSLGVSVFHLDRDDLDYLSTFDLVHTGDCSRTEAQLAEIAGVARVSFDFSNRPLDYAEALLPHVDIATFSASDASEREVHDIIAWAHDLGPSRVFVTRGQAGAVFSDGEHVVSRTPVPVSVVDTLGAGDAFIGSACVALLAGCGPDEVLARATAHAALTCASFGAFGHETPDPAPRPRPAVDTAAASSRAMRA